MACAEAGYPYHKERRFWSDKLRVFWKSTFFGTLHSHIDQWKQARAILAIGGSVYDECPHGSPKHLNLEENLFKPWHKDVSETIISSGYRLKFFDEIADVQLYPEMIRRVKKLITKYNQPLSLQQLAANTIRTKLRPNAVAASKRFVKEGTLSESQARFLTLGLTEQDFKNKWRISYCI